MRRDLILISISMMTWGVGEGMFLFFSPLYMQELGANAVAIGSILGLTGLAMTLSYLPAGYLSDRIGRRPMLYTAWLMGTAATWIMAYAKGLPMFVAGSILYNMTAFVVVPLNSYVTAARGNWSVGRALTLISATFNAGAVIGPLIGGWIGSRMGLHTNFTIAAWFFIASTLMVLFIRAQPIEASLSEEKHAGLRELLQARYIQYLAVVFIAVFSMYLAIPLSQNFLQNERGINLAQMGVLISARSVGVVLLNLTLGQLNARIGFLLTHLCMAFFSILLLRGNGFYAYLVGYLLMGSYTTARSLITAQGRSLAQASNMGVAYGMIETAAASAIILASPLAGILYAKNPNLIYSTSLVLIIAALIVAIFFSPLRARDFRPQEKEGLEPARAD